MANKASTWRKAHLSTCPVSDGTTLSRAEQKLTEAIETMAQGILDFRTYGIPLKLELADMRLESKDRWSVEAYQVLSTAADQRLVRSDWHGLQMLEENWTRKGNLTEVDMVSR